MTAPRQEPGEPRIPRPASRPFVPQPRPSEEDLLELSEPCDYPRYPDRWFPEYPDISELPGIGRTRDPEPDLEAEP